MKTINHNIDFVPIFPPIIRSGIFNFGDYINDYVKKDKDEENEFICQYSSKYSGVIYEFKTKNKLEKIDFKTFCAISIILNRYASDERVILIEEKESDPALFINIKTAEVLQELGLKNHGETSKRIIQSIKRLSNIFISEKNYSKNDEEDYTKINERLIVIEGDDNKYENKNNDIFEDRRFKSSIKISFNYIAAIYAIKKKKATDSFKLGGFTFVSLKDIREKSPFDLMFKLHLEAVAERSPTARFLSASELAAKLFGRVPPGCETARLARRRAVERIGAAMAALEGGGKGAAGGETATPTTRPLKIEAESRPDRRKRANKSETEKWLGASRGWVIGPNFARNPPKFSKNPTQK